MEKENKPEVFLSILKWYSVVWVTLCMAVLFADLVNPPLGADPSVDVLSFVMALPPTAYLWSLVSRKLT